MCRKKICCAPTQKKKLCINTANLHYGGGVQVATSFLRELNEIESVLSDKDVTIYLSSQIVANLGDALEQLKQKFDIQEVNIFGLAAFSPLIRRKFKKFDLIFSVFGPDYLPMIGAKRVVGFAQAWIIYNKSEAYQKLSLISLYKSRMIFWLKKQLFKGADSYIVELEHVKEGMLAKKLGHQGNIYVAHNTVSSAYRQIDEQKLHFNSAPSYIFRLGIISRSYSHKNLSIIPEVKRVLKEDYQREVAFYVTFKKEEFERESAAFQNQVVNLGPKKVDECIDTYFGFDAVFFPSLLESFSATPLEAMATGRALFASDRPFNRDICGEHAYYFDPLNPEDAARVINDYIEKKWGCDLEERLAAREHAMNFSNPRDRALKYIEIINKVLS